MNSPEASALPMVGDRAPNLQLRDETGKLVQLSQYWAERPLVLLFGRHLG